MPLIDTEVVKDKSLLSISTVADIHFVENFRLVDKYDSVQISPDLYGRIFLEDANDIGVGQTQERYVLLKFLGSPDYFKEYRLYKLNAVNSRVPPNSIVLVNTTNLAQFENQLTLNKAIIQSINPIDIPTVDKVFVEVPEHIYNILNTRQRESVLDFFLRVLNHKGRILTDGDSIREINGKVILCEPVRQGRIDFMSEIVFVMAKNKRAIEKDIEGNKTEAFMDDDGGLDLTTYLSSSLHLKGSRRHLNVELKVLPLLHKITVDTTHYSLSKEDSELFVFVTMRTIAKLGFPIFNGDLVCLKCNDETTIVRIFTFVEPNLAFNHNTLYLSPFLIINLNLSSSSKVHLEPFSGKDKSLQNVFPTASSVTISRVASPISMDKTYQKYYFSELKTAFSEQFRSVKKNDLILVTVDSIRAKTMFDISQNLSNDKSQLLDDGASENSNVIPRGDPDSVAWFRIIEVDGEGSMSDYGPRFIIDPQKTRLISFGVDFVRLPQNEFSKWYDYCELPPIFNYNKLIGSNSSVFTYAYELKKIITTCLSAYSKFKLRTTILLNSMVRGIGKSTVLRNLSIELGLNLIELDCFDLINPGAELKTIGFLKGKIEKFIRSQEESTSNVDAFHVIYLKHVENLCIKSNQNEQGANQTTSLSLKVIDTLKEYLDTYPNLIVVMSCNDIDKLSEELLQIIKFQIDFSVPSEAERLEIFKFLVTKEVGNLGAPDTLRPFEGVAEFESQFDISKVPFDVRSDVSFSTLALQSAGLTPRDLISILNKAKKVAIKRLRKVAKSNSFDVEKLVKIGNGGTITWIPQDFAEAINDARNQYSDSIGAPRIPNVQWEDIGGLDVVKDEILDTIDMPLKHPELFANGLKKRSGILFYGPPGTGKTLLAKAIASNFSLNFFSVKGPELLNMYIGESEANVRRVFQKARDAKPCVIFFDELDSVAPKRGNQGDSGGVMDRIVSQLLAELDGMSGNGENNGEGVFVVGATNRPDLLDEALLRPGRFDKMLYLGISDTDEKQTKILEALTRKFKLEEDVDLSTIAKSCPYTYTGADFYALCSDSMLNAMTRCAGEIDEKLNTYNQKQAAEGKPAVSTRWWFDNIAKPEDMDVFVTMADFYKAQEELVPSVSADELQHYLRIRRNFEGEKEKALANNGNTLENGY